jgi:rod shape-determining protein MreC
MNFILRYGTFFLFLILEGIALYMVGRYNKAQNEIYQSSANLLTGVVYENFSNVQQYFSMKDIADSLARENANLKTQLEASKYIATQQRGTVRFPLDTSTIRPDTAQTKDVEQLFTYQAAEVISNSIARNDNYLTINRGSIHGVRKGMGIIAPDGLVGIVQNVEPHFSQVMSILHRRAKISAMIKRNRYFGSMMWHSGNPRIMTLEDIPKHAEVMKGDTIMTTGFSEVFPGGLRIGRVVDFRVENGNNSYTIDVELWNDIADTKYVYIVENLMIEELKKFKQ